MNVQLAFRYGGRWDTLKSDYEQQKQKEINFKHGVQKRNPKGFSKVDYYKAQAQNMKVYDYIQKEKYRIRTPKREEVNEVIEAYIELGQHGTPPEPIRILRRICTLNRKVALAARKKGN